MNRKYAIASYVVLFGFSSSFFLECFNPGYHGNDPYVSLQTMWIPERFVVEDYIKYFPYYKHYIEQIPLLNPATINISKLPFPYNTVRALTPYTKCGYYVNSEAIVKLFQNNIITSVIEIGSDYGLSTRHIASLLPASGKMFAIDCWDFTSEGYSNTRYIPFLSNVIQAGLTDKIVPIKQLSQDAVGMFEKHNLKFDMIYVDGDHETPSVMRDLTLYYPLLKEKGIMCGDDWMLKTVRAGIVPFAQAHNLTIYCGGNFWFFKNEGTYQQKCFYDNWDGDFWKFN